MVTSAHAPATAPAKTTALAPAPVQATTPAADGPYRPPSEASGRRAVPPVRCADLMTAGGRPPHQGVSYGWSGAGAAVPAALVGDDSESEQGSESRRGLEFRPGLESGPGPEAEGGFEPGPGPEAGRGPRLGIGPEPGAGYGAGDHAKPGTGVALDRVKPRNGACLNRAEPVGRSRALRCFRLRRDRPAGDGLIVGVLTGGHIAGRRRGAGSRHRRIGVAAGTGRVPGFEAYIP